MKKISFCSETLSIPDKNDISDFPIFLILTDMQKMTVVNTRFCSGFFCYRALGSCNKFQGLGLVILFINSFYLILLVFIFINILYDLILDLFILV